MRGSVREIIWGAVACLVACSGQVDAPAPNDEENDDRASDASTGGSSQGGQQGDPQEAQCFDMTGGTERCADLKMCWSGETEFLIDESSCGASQCAFVGDLWASFTFENEAASIKLNFTALGPDNTTADLPELFELGVVSAKFPVTGPATILGEGERFAILNQRYSTVDDFEVLEIVDGRIHLVATLEPGAPRVSVHTSGPTCGGDVAECPCYLDGEVGPIHFDVTLPYE